MNLSEHLTLEEVTKSPTAIRLGISNIPIDEHLENLKRIAIFVFEKIRNKFNVPIQVLSGYRGPELNTAVGGSKNSDHMKGMALDLRGTNNVSNKQIFDYIKDYLEYTQLIWEFGDDSNPEWVHVSYNRDNLKNEILKAIKINGKTKYIKL